MAVKNHLKELRTKEGLLQQDIASSSGSCVRTISRIERGERTPSLEMALRISACLHLPVEKVFELDRF